MLQSIRVLSESLWTVFSRRPNSVYIGSLSEFSSRLPGCHTALGSLSLVGLSLLERLAHLEDGSGGFLRSESDSRGDLGWIVSNVSSKSP